MRIGSSPPSAGRSPGKSGGWSCCGLAAEKIRAAGAPYTSVYLYMLHGDELVLEAFAGRDTEHTRIPVGKGVCGTAVATGQDQNVPDVRAVENYIACNTWTRSELVVLIRRGDHDPGPDRRGQRRARSVHARGGGRGPEGGGRPGRPALTVRAWSSARFTIALPDGHRFPIAKYARLREEVVARGLLPGPTRSRSPTARTAGRSSSCTRRGTWTP